MEFGLALFIEVIRGGFSVGLLLLTWYGGQRVLAEWELRKQRRAMDIESAQRLQELIGEWKSIWRAWKAFQKRKGEISVEPPPGKRWDLLERAAKAEGGIEAIVLRLSMERDLLDSDRENLGLFRQSFQQLRESIRDDKPLDWQREDPEYWLSHELAIYITAIIERPSPAEPLTTTDAIRQLKSVLDINSPSWYDAISKRRNGMMERSSEKLDSS